MLLAPEAELVLRSAKLSVDPRWHALCSHALRWGDVLAVATDERAASVLSHRLPPAAPDEAKAAFRRIALVTEFRNAQLNQLLRETLVSLDRSGVETMLLKGCALVARGIATTAERPMSDIDLLVPPEVAHEAWTTLQHSGWRWDRDRFPGHLYERQHHLPPLVDTTGTSYRLEIHHDLFPPHHPFSLTSAEVWRRGALVPFGEVETRVPDLCSALIHTAVHFVWSHTFQSKTWRTFRDLELVLARTEVDWSALVEAAYSARAASCTYWTLRLARTVIGTAVPDDVLQRLRPRRSEPLLKRLERHYARNMLFTGTRCPSDRFNRLLWEAGVCPRSQGHGAARPWDGTFRIPEVVEWERARGRAGVAHRARQTARLVQYVWNLR